MRKLVAVFALAVLGGVAGCGRTLTAPDYSRCPVVDSLVDGAVKAYVQVCR